KTNKTEVLKQLARCEGFSVPSLYPPVKKGRIYAPDLETGAIKKRVKKEIDDSFPTQLEKWIVPITQVVFDRLNVEIARGCPQNCRFCQAKSYYAPYRSRSPEKNIDFITRGLKETGFESFSLSTLSSGDYPYLNELLELIPGVIPTGVSFSLSSLRPSTLSHQLLSTIALFKRTGLTIVPEAGTRRLRNVINKNVSDDEIFQAVQLALQNKWQKIKLYFML
ncbi:MAG: radical SAM protein, partial [bacterium]|nr:radical SAM protein [bacterium]